MGGDRLFWDIAEPLLASGELEEGTMMGHRCVRADGAFVAMTDSQSDGLIVKLTAERVAALIATGSGAAFAPAGKTFKEWVLVVEQDEELWSALLSEAIGFARA